MSNGVLVHCRVLGVATGLENALAMLFTLLILEPQGLWNDMAA